MEASLATCTQLDYVNAGINGAVKSTYTFPVESEVKTSLTNVMSDFKAENIPSDVSVMDYVKKNYRTIADGKAFHVFDIGAIEQRFAKWRSFLSRADPFYAVKCNSDPVLLRTLFSHGAGFDCASKHEIQLCLDLGCSPDRIIFANPAKLPSDIVFAAHVGVTKMTFDSEDELYKIDAAFKEANSGNKPEPVVRIITDDSHSVCKFSAKFGAPVEDAEHLMNVAKSLGMGVVGVSFHVGSGCASKFSFVKAITDARAVFEAGYKLGHPMYLLDLGGGFPANDNSRVPFTTIANAMAPLIDELFPESLNADRHSSILDSTIPKLHVIAEPGRYFASDTMMFVSPIISRRLNMRLPSWETRNGEAAKQPHILYYVSDGVYGAFNGILYDHYIPTPPLVLFHDAEKQVAHDNNLIAHANRNDDGNSSDSDNEDGNDDHLTQGFKKKITYAEGTYRAKVFGPTCDGLDCLFDEVPLPVMDLGDWLVFPEMGAYSIAAQSSFNGIPRPAVVYVRSDPQHFDYDFVSQGCGSVDISNLNIESGNIIDDAASPM